MSSPSLSDDDSSDASSVLSTDDDSDSIGPGIADEPIVLKKKRIQRRRRDLEPKANAPWQRMLDRAEESSGVSNPDSMDGRYFRRRFRVPYSMFKALIQVMLDDNWFPGDFEADGGGKYSVLGIKGASLHVKVLSVFRALGRGVCFDELYDGSGLSEAVTSTFFHRFVAIFVQRYGIALNEFLNEQ